MGKALSVIFWTVTEREIKTVRRLENVECDQKTLAQLGKNRDRTNELEFEWQQVSSSVQNSSQYSGCY